MTDNLFVAARKASGQTQAQAAATCKLAVGTFGDRERKPADFRLGELRRMYDTFGEGARMVLMQAVDSFFSS